jgi:hypothetical protein
MNIESNVLKKTNKYVYLSNGTHMTHSDHHRYKQEIRNELAIIHAKEYKESVEVLVQSLKEKQRLEDLINKIQEDNYVLEYQVHQERQANEADWEGFYRKADKERDEANRKLDNHARKIYSQLSELPILKDYQNNKGIKFIIQQNYKTDEYRFCFDPYEIGFNYHSNLSEFFREENWGTVNGGWLKVIDNILTLYAKSGDYGVYDDNIAIKAAKLIFPNKKIRSFAGMQWTDF